MDDYDSSATQASKIVTETFSSSFSSASKLFDSSIRQDVYNIYGLVRIADEIVDTYRGKRARQLLDDLQTETHQALKQKFSANIIVHAFMLTATKYGIGPELIDPFFESMRTDLTKTTFSKTEYERYVYGSAEVVGLMCLRVFCLGDDKLYSKLKPGACALGAAFQKVNFLRDIRDDFETRGRYYFPIGSYETFSEADKQRIIHDIDADFRRAQRALAKLPANSRKACTAAFSYYQALLRAIQSTPVETLKQQRVSLSKPRKLALLARVKLGRV